MGERRTGSDNMMVLTLMVLLFGVGWIICDWIITNRRVAKNQSEWDAYCKKYHLTETKKICEYLPFCERQKAKYGWKYYYFPRR